MKTYENCFLAVPLAERYAEAHRELLDGLSAMPELALDDPDTPHITLYYLDDQPERAFPAITEAMTAITGCLNTKITVGGYGTFVPSRPKVLYLGVARDPGLVRANRTLQRTLRTFRSEENRKRFTPHLTVAYVRRSDRRVHVRLAEVERRLDAVRWTFPVTEIALYGKPPGADKREVLRRVACEPAGD